MTGAEKDASRVPKGAHRLPAQGDSKAAKSRRREREKREEDWRKSRVLQPVNEYEFLQLAWLRGQRKHPARGVLRDGNQICYKFAKGQPGARQEPCGDDRAHVCQLCLGQRPNVQCLKGKSGDKGGDGKGK